MELSKKVELIALYEIYGKSLTDNQQQVIDLCVLQDLSLGEASEVLKSTNDNTVKQQLNNILEEL